MWDIIAGMSGISGMPAGHYCNELEKNDEGEELRIHVTDEDWIDCVNDQGQVEYELKKIDRYEQITEEEAKLLVWDWHE